ncbi:MAG: hypothetical protein RPT25_10565 [Cycloclasticus sp.]
MLNEEKAIQLAIKKLQESGFDFVEDSAKALYRNRKLSVGAQKKGWVVSCDLNVPQSMEPDMVFVHVSDPEGDIYIPPVM